jgi:predicted unusual protein kinase regulating ubiquinone biosynthesis (AarF/ABC1/UbiB family)
VSDSTRAWSPTVDASIGYAPPQRAPLPRPGAGTTARRAGQVAMTVAAELARVPRRGPTAPAAARALCRAFMRLGGTYMKLGQVVAAAPGMFGEDVAAEFRACLDTGPVVPYTEVQATIERELGQPLHAAFSWFEPRPIGQASLAVVHRAQTTDGRTVAVKMLRPGIETVVAADFALMRGPVRVVADRVGSETAGAVDGLLDGLQEQLEEELDLTNEVRSMDYHRRWFAAAGLAGIVVPECVPELSTRRVLTMEYLDGRPIDHLKELPELPPSASLVGEDLVRGWLMGALGTGAFHADLHAGNVLLLRDGRLGLIDWGIVGRLDDQTRRFFRAAVGAMLGDPERWAEVGRELREIYGDVLPQAMGVPEDQVVELIRGMFEPFFTQPFSAFTIAQLIEQMPQGGRMARTVKSAEPARMAETLRRWRTNRETRRMAAERGVPDMPFNRGVMMLVKQLLYLDSHGHLLFGDRALLDDREFYRLVLDGAEGGNV